MGHFDSGLLAVWSKAGGYYMGMSQKFNGNGEVLTNPYTRCWWKPIHHRRKDKIKERQSINGITTNGLKLEDGSEIEADVVLFCTGLFSFKFKKIIDWLI